MASADGIPDKEIKFFALVRNSYLTLVIYAL